MDHTPEIHAALARMAQREQEACRVATGEPCRCPEHAQRCQCGAYRDAVSAFLDTSTDRYEGKVA